MCKVSFVRSAQACAIGLGLVLTQHMTLPGMQVLFDLRARETEVLLQSVVLRCAICARIIMMQGGICETGSGHGGPSGGAGICEHNIQARKCKVSSACSHAMRYPALTQRTARRRLGHMRARETQVHVQSVPGEGVLRAWQSQVLVQDSIQTTVFRNRYEISGSDIA